MRTTLQLVAAAFVAFALSVVVFLPASFMTRYLPPGVTTGVMSGTVWSGATDALSVNGHFIGALKWRVRPLSLFRGRLALDVQLLRPDAGGQGRVYLSTAQRLEVEDAQLRWPLETLPVRFGRSAWTGHLDLNLSQANAGPTGVKRLLGTIDALNLREGPQGIDVGSFRAIFNEASQQGERIVGRLESLEGPMDVTGTITLGPGRSYLVAGLVAARPGAPQAIVDGLSRIGPPDAEGRRQFAVEGTY